MVIKSIKNIQPGMILGKTIYGDNYEVLLNQGVALTLDHIRRLEKRGYGFLYVEEEGTEDIPINTIVTDEERVQVVKNVMHTCHTLKSTLGEMKDTTYKTIMEHINKEEIKKSFQESHAFKMLLEDAKSLIDEIMSRDVLLCLDFIQSHDNYIYEHSVDTGIIALVLAKRLFLGRKRLEQFAVGIFLHDIGMTFIDKNILNKQTNLTEAEYQEIKHHPIYGYKLLKENPNIGFASAHVAYQHHERQDGTGYPRGLKGTNKIDLGEITYDTGEKLILLAEIASIADFYHACISNRPFRAPLPYDLVYDLIKGGAGTQFNKELVNCFLEITPKYPTGSKVKIINGAYEDFTGYVVSITDRKQLCKPKIRLLYDRENKRITPVEIDLSAETYPFRLKCIEDYGRRTTGT